MMESYYGQYCEDYQTETRKYRLRSQNLVILKHMSHKPIYSAATQYCPHKSYSCARKTNKNIMGKSVLFWHKFISTGIIKYITSYSKSECIYCRNRNRQWYFWFYTHRSKLCINLLNSGVSLNMLNGKQTRYTV